jgi:hypothetical protein
MSSGPHKTNPITFRPPADGDDREWLEKHATATGRAVGAVIVQAIREYRARETGGVTTSPPSRP